MAITHPSVKIPGQPLAAIVDWNASHIIDGNTGEILFREAGGTIGTDANLFWDDATKRLTIGATNPTDPSVIIHTSGAFLRAQRVGRETWGFYLTGAGATGLGIFNETDAAYRLFLSEAGNVGIGTTVPGKKLVLQDGKRPAILLGADADATTLTNATNKQAQIGMPHYTIAEEPIMMMFGSAQAALNPLFIGGGSGGVNAVTAISFYTAANTTTLAGTERMKIDSAGGIHMLNMKSGINQGAAGAIAGELWFDTDDDNTIKMGV